MTHKRLLWPSLAVCALAALLLLLNGSASTVKAAPTRDEGSVSASALSCRYGVALSAKYPKQVSWVHPLGASWYLDFTAHPPYSLISEEFMQVIRVRQKMDEDCNYIPGYTTSPEMSPAILGSLVTSHPGNLWIIGNEPDRGPNPEEIGKINPKTKTCYRGQDDTHPEVYAQIYHDLYAFIKSYDPTARVAIAGLVEVTPNRLQYLDKVWQAYLNRYGTTMPVDVWNFHLYILPEAFFDGQPNSTANVALGTDPAGAMRDSNGSAANCTDAKDDIYCVAEHDNMDIFKDQVVRMRTWMEQHGQRNKPLILTEYSLLYPYHIDNPGPEQTCFVQDEYGQCFTPERVRAFMTSSFNYLDSAADPDLGNPADQNRLVQRWLWFGTLFSTNDEDAGYVSNLLVDTQDALSPLGQLYHSIVAERSTYVNLRPDPIPSISVAASGGVATVSLSVNIYNSGTAPVDGPFKVTFYSDSDMTQPIASVVLTGGLAGCEARRVTAAVSWPDLTVGVHPFWVRIDSGDAIPESDETDNVASSSVSVSPSYHIVIPLISGS